MAADLKKAKRAINICYGVLALIVVLSAVLGPTPGPCDIPPFMLIILYAIPVMVAALFIVALIAVSHRPYRPLFLHSVIATVLFFLAIMAGLLITDVIKALILWL